MSLTRQHYVAIADMLRAERDAIRSSEGHFYTCGARESLDRMEERLVSYFQADNPNFDPGRFRRACQP